MIDGLNFGVKVISAPMAGVSDKAFRMLVREFFSGLIYTEMVNDKAVIHNNERTREAYNIEDEIPPVGVQIFGSTPETMAEAAKMVAETGANIIDINMGCPVPKVVRKKSGCALMLAPEKAERIVSSVVDAVEVPVSVKMRKGWDENTVNSVELARIVEAAGAAAVTVHGRTGDQFYKGSADWNVIKEVVNSVSIPVIGNGDVFNGHDALSMLEYTGCEGVMIGRGSLGNPWIFKEALGFIHGQGSHISFGHNERVDMALKHLKLLVKCKGEVMALKQIRKHISWYLKGLRNATEVRREIYQADDLKGVEAILQNFKVKD